MADDDVQLVITVWPPGKKRIIGVDYMPDSLWRWIAQRYKNGDNLGEYITAEQRAKAQETLERKNGSFTREEEIRELWNSVLCSICPRICEDYEKVNRDFHERHQI